MWRPIQLALGAVSCLARALAQVGRRAGPPAPPEAPTAPPDPPQAAPARAGCGGPLMRTFEAYKKVLVLDLDETLVHSTTALVQHHFTVTVNLDGSPTLFYVTKRPHVATWYHVVVFTSSLQSYADPVLDKLDRRSSCVLMDGHPVKNLTAVCTDMSQTLLVDNNPLAFSLQPTNGLPIQTWDAQDPFDTALLDMLPFLNALRYVQDVRSILSLRLTRQ
eukprot:m51a1_g3614 hypothetical protein (219) ;mRNA; r:62750-63738